jgi:hypothetical protein
VVVGEALPDRGGAGRGVCLDHRVDVAVQAVQCCGLAVDFLARWWFGGGEGLDDGAVADVVLALDSPLWQVGLGVAADRGVCLLPATGVGGSGA